MSLKLMNLYKLCKNKFQELPISWRIAGWYSLFLLIMLVGLTVFIMRFIALVEGAELFAMLREQTKIVAHTIDDFYFTKEGIYFSHFNKNGKFIRGIVPKNFPPTTERAISTIKEVTYNDETFYYTDSYIMNSRQNGWVRGIYPAHQLEKRNDSLLLSFMAGGTTFIIVVTIGAYLLIRRGLRPIRKMAQTAYDIGNSHDLSKRIPTLHKGNDEIFQLQETFNFMLESIDKQSRQERQFSSDVSHELRTPIAVIQAESEYGKSYITSVEEAKESFSHIFEQSKYMTNIVSQLLDLARLDHTPLIDKEVFNITELLTHIADDYNIILSQKGISFTTSFSPDMYVEGNPLLLKRAIINLLDNASKFGATQITMRLIATIHLVRIEIIDNGEGIEEEKLDAIWRRFYQVHQSRNKYHNSGLGLGLVFVKQIIKLHNGKIVVRSTPKSRTVFEILLEKSDFSKLS